MKARPILFSGPMIQALLREIEKPGTGKTQTRRIVKPDIGEPPSPGAYFDAYNHGTQWNWWTADHRVHNNAPIIRCPYGQTGDLLWVRETVALVCNVDPPWVIYRANGYEAECRRHGFDNPPPESELRWRPSIHMPRWASRLTLELTHVRVERVQDITIGDAEREGISLGWNREGGAQKRFLDLFYDINKRAPRGENPWVWVLSFRVHQINVDEFMKGVANAKG